MWKFIMYKFTFETFNSITMHSVNIGVWTLEFKSHNILWFIFLTILRKKIHFYGKWEKQPSIVLFFFDVNLSNKKKIIGPVWWKIIEKQIIWILTSNMVAHRINFFFLIIKNRKDNLILPLMLYTSSHFQTIHKYFIDHLDRYRSHKLRHVD